MGRGCRFDECIEDSRSGRLILSYFTCLEGLWGAPDSANRVERVGPLAKDVTLLLRARL